MGNTGQRYFPKVQNVFNSLVYFYSHIKLMQQVQHEFFLVLSETIIIEDYPLHWFMLSCVDICTAPKMMSTLKSSSNRPSNDAHPELIPIFLLIDPNDPQGIKEQLLKKGLRIFFLFCSFFVFVHF